MLRVERLKLLNQKLVNYHLLRGDQVELVGANGIGKSLLLKALAYLYPCEYEQFRYKEQPIDSITLSVFRNEVMYFPTKPFLIEGTFEDNLKFPFNYNVHQKKSYDSNKTQFLLDYFKHSHALLSKKANHLSTGECQMLSFIRGVLLSPEVFLFDEPISGLDKERKQLFLKYIQEFNLTTIVVTHEELNLKQKILFESLVEI